MSKAYLCCAEPGAEVDCKHLRKNHTCASQGAVCNYEPWPKKQSFWCWIRCHPWLVAGFKYNFDSEREDGAEPIRVCKCMRNDSAVPTYIDQLRDWRNHVYDSRSV